MLIRNSLKQSKFMNFVISMIQSDDNCDSCNDCNASTRESDSNVCDDGFITVPRNRSRQHKTPKENNQFHSTSSTKSDYHRKQNNDNKFGKDGRGGRGGRGGRSVRCENTFIILLYFFGLI